MKSKLMLFIGLLLASTLCADDLYDTSTLQTVELKFNQSDWWQQLQHNNELEENILATLIINGETLDSVGVQFRGNTSDRKTENSEKKSFNIELDWLKDQSYDGYEELNLLNNFSDPSFLREVLFTNTCRQVMPSAKANFVILKINGENWGVYTSVQQLDGKFIRDWFPSNDGTRWRAGINNNLGNDGGGGGKGFHPDAALTWRGADTSAYAEAYDLKNTNQENPWEPLVNTCDILNNTDLADLPAHLPNVLNIDRALWLCALEIVFHDDDGHVFKRGSDYYLYYEPESGRIHFIQYDANTCMGMPREGQWPPFYRADDDEVPIMQRLMKIPQYRQRYLAHVRSILDNYMNEDYLYPLISQYDNLIKDEVALDTKKLYSTTEYERDVDELKVFVQERRNFLLAYDTVSQPVPQVLAVNKTVNDFDDGQSLSISAQIDPNVPVSHVNLFLATSHYGVFESLPMFDDGAHIDKAANDGIYGIELPTYPCGTTLRYYIQAIADDNVGTMVFEPFAEHLAATHVVTFAQAENSPLIFNEIMAKNETAFADPQGEFDDWIELKNISDETVDVSGMYLSDNLKNPLKWQFPENTEIAAGDYLVVWADEDGKDEPGLHANFKLSSSGETILLFDSGDNQNALLDSTTFPAQVVDVAFGRHSDMEWTMLSEPTPGTHNADPAVTFVQESENLPNDFKLYSAYPNPFNPQTTIKFSLPESGHVKLTIYNLLGMHTTTLVDERRDAGEYSVVWDVYDENDNISSGVYFYELQVRGGSHNFVEIKRMTVLK